MGDNDGSSTAAQGAQASTEHHVNGSTPGVFGWLKGIFGTRPTEIEVSSPRPKVQTHGMMNLRRMRVYDVAIPKAEIIAVPLDITKDDLVKVFHDSGLTRLPVYDGTLDMPVGMAHLKDFALMHGFGGGAEFNLRKMVRPLLFVPPSMPIGVLLTKMQTERRHMALVIDEYGGVDGLVTIEDLIEQVIGDIEDEHDTDEDKFWTRERNGYLVLAKTPLEDFEAELGQRLTAHDAIDPEEIDTLGGLVFMLAGRVPARGEVVPHPEGVEFEVVDADPRRIKRLRVRKSGHKPAPVPDAAKGAAPVVASATSGEATREAAGG